MANFSGITIPTTYMAAYSAVPLRVKDFDAAQIEQYKYVVNILFNKIALTTTEAYQFEGYVFTKVNFATAHSFKLGDILFLNQTGDAYTDYYTVVTIPSSTSIVIDLVLGQPLVGTTNVANVIKYKLTPDPDGDAKLDLSNTLKDYVTQNFEDSNNPFNGVNTRFDYELLVGYEGRALFQFNDNSFQSGSVGFIATGLTATTQVDFEIGDEIIIQQNLYEWPYTDNYFSNGNLGFTGTTANIFSSGDTITVTGQITQPFYNGDSTVLSTGSNFLVINKGFTTSTPVEGGKIYGIPVPEYNTTAIITNIVYSAGTGVIIITDQPFIQSTPPIGGTIRNSDGKLITSFNHLSITGLSVFNSYIPQTNYSIPAFDPYVVQTRSSNLNYFSTIYNVESSGLRYRIQPETKSWLLTHTLSGVCNGGFYQFYNSADSVLGSLYITNQTSNVKDFYIPVGLEQIGASTSKTQVLNTFSAYSGSVSYYYVNPSLSSSTRGNKIYFEINDDCSKFETYHLLWKDAKGSWISYPFKYLSQESMDVDRKNYYQTEGTWKGGTFGYESFGRGETTFFARSRNKITINSGWIDEFENDLMSDLLQSAKVFIQTPQDNIMACVIENKNITFGKDINDEIFQYKFDIIFSNNNIRL